MKAIIGLLLIVVGIVLGVYVGIFICFIGGIVDIVETVKDQTFLASTIAWGIFKVAFAGLFGWVSFYVFFFPGLYMLND